MYSSRKSISTNILSQWGTEHSLDASSYTQPLQLPIRFVREFSVVAFLDRNEGRLQKPHHIGNWCVHMESDKGWRCSVNFQLHCVLHVSVLWFSAINSWDETPIRGRVVVICVRLSLGYISCLPIIHRNSAGMTCDGQVGGSSENDDWPKMFVDVRFGFE